MIPTLFANWKFNNSIKVPSSAQRVPDSGGYYSDSWPFTVPLRINPSASAAFVNVQLVLDSGNTCKIISKQGAEWPKIIFALTGRRVTRDMLVIPFVEQNKTHK